MFSGFENAARQLNHFTSHLTSEFNYVLLLIGIVGVMYVLHQNRSLFFFLTIAFLSCLALSINYDIHDIDSYFLLAFLMIGCFVFVGLQAIQNWIASFKQESLSRWLLIPIFLLPVSQFALNEKNVDESDNFLLEDYSISILNNVDANAVVFTYQWDYFVGPSIYYQNVRQLRRDVAVVDKELLRRSWYFIQLERNHAWLTERSRDRIDRYLSELYKFEHNLPYNANVLELRYVEMVNDLIDNSFGDRPVYVGPEIEPEFGSRYARIPSGSLYRLAGLAPIVEGKVPSARIQFRPTSFSNYLGSSLRLIWAQMLTTSAAYWFEQGEKDFADDILAKALEVRPDFQAAIQLKNAWRSTSAGEEGDSAEQK